MFVPNILPLFKALTADDQDSVRLLAIENCASIAKLLDEDDNSLHVLPVVRSSCEDRSWRVRFSIAKDFFPVCTFHEIQRFCLLKPNKTIIKIRWHKLWVEAQLKLI